MRLGAIKLSVELEAMPVCASTSTTYTPREKTGDVRLD